MDPFSMQFSTVEGSSNYQITGSGTDQIGMYTLTGEHNHKNGRMSVDKKYTKGTGCKYQNLGHTVKLRLAWDR